MTEQNGHVLETEIVKEVFPPVAEYTKECSDGSPLAFKTSVAVVYEQKWYIREVKDVDDDEVEISIMIQKKSNYHWPRTDNKTWLLQTNLLCQIEVSHGDGHGELWCIIHYGFLWGFPWGNYFLSLGRHIIENIWKLLKIWKALNLSPAICTYLYAITDMHASHICITLCCICKIVGSDSSHVCNVIYNDVTS